MVDAFHRDNHFVPLGYLKPWELPDGKIWTYRILVPHKNVPIWKRASKKAVGWHSHLYTQMVAGQETDDVERWFDHEFENSAGRAQCGREQRGHPRRLAYSSDFSQWVALVNNIPTLASGLNGLSIANVAASSHSYDLNSRRSAGKRELKFKIHRKGATAMVSFSRAACSLLHMPMHYRVLVTGSAVKTRGQ